MFGYLSGKVVWQIPDLRDQESPKSQMDGRTTCDDNAAVCT